MITTLPDLVAARRACRICMTRDPDRIVAGAAFDFDPPVVSYWSQWLGHPRPRLLIVGQDFGDVGYFERHRGADDPRSQTNANLHRLLTIAGFTPGLPPAPDSDTPVYLTNAILCLKRGAMNAPVPARWVRACAVNHLHPLIDALRPAAVVGMGSHGWAAVRLALDLADAPRAIGVAAGGFWQAGALQAFAVGHCGGLGLVSRPWAAQVEDWERIGSAVSRMSSERDRGVSSNLA